MTSQSFKIERNLIHILIGGGSYKGRTELQLLIGDQVVATLAGQNNNKMRRDAFPVQAYEGQTARLRIIDQRTEGWGNIGFVLLQRGDLEGAIRALKKATAFNFRFIQAFATLANAYLMNGQIKESIEANLKALKLSPEFAVAHNNLAIAYLEKGVYDKAAAHCDRAMELAEAWRQHISRWFYPCGHQMMVGLAEMYTGDPRFRAHDHHCSGQSVGQRAVRGNHRSADHPIFYRIAGTGIDNM